MSYVAKEGIMTIGELIKLLEAYPGGQEVILSIDEEGNGFHPVREVTSQLYCPRTGEIWGYNDLDEIGQEPYQHAKVLWP